MSPLGHNGYSFDDVVAENLERGLLLAQRDCAARALQDTRLGQRHRVVLAQLILMMNQQSGVAYPGRKFLSEITGYSEAGIAKTISELVDWGYVVSTRRAPEPGRRPLAHYAIVKPTIEELQQVIAWHIEALRRPDVTPVGNVTWQSKFTPIGNVTPVDNVTPVGNVSDATQKKTKQIQDTVSDVTPVGNVTPVVPTVTSIDSSSISNIITSGERGAGRERKSSKGTRFDPQWILRDHAPDWGRWVTENFKVRPSEVEREGDRFRDYWIAQPGAKGVKVDWLATWRNWARRAFSGRERDTFADAALFAADVAAEESEHDRQLALVREQRRQERLEDGLD